MWVWTQEEPWQVLKRLWLHSGVTSWVPFGEWLLTHLEEERMPMFQCECGKTFKSRQWFTRHLEATKHTADQTPAGGDSESSPGVARKVRVPKESLIALKVTILGQDLTIDQFLALYDDMTHIRKTMMATEGGKAE